MPDHWPHSQLLSILACIHRNVEHDTDRRGNQPNAEIEVHQAGEVVRVYTRFFDNGKQHRSKYKNIGRAVHDHAHAQQEDIYE